jgi:SAM-dependent methyltransferase
MSTGTEVDVRAHVRKHYAERVREQSSCCGGISEDAGSSCCGTEPPAELVSRGARLGYTAEEMTAVPQAAAMTYGCGNPQALAALKPGEVVADLGSGGGLDCFLAARQVGPDGHVIGVDMTPEMIERASRNALTGERGYERCYRNRVEYDGEHLSPRRFLRILPKKHSLANAGSGAEFVRSRGAVMATQEYRVNLLRPDQGRTVAAIALLVLAGLATVTGCRARPEHTLLFFYEVICASCEDSRRMEALAGEIVQLARTDQRITAQTHDVFRGDGLAAFRDAAARVEGNALSEEFPVMIVDGQEVYQGEEEIVAKLDDLRDEYQR